MSNKLIFILSERDDFSTNDVIEWLIHFGCQILRINNENKVRVLNYDIGKNRVKVASEVHGIFFISDDKFSAFWYRRGDLNIGFLLPDIPEKYAFMKNPIFRAMDEKAVLLKELMYNCLSNVRSIGNVYTDTNVNKIKILISAQNVGILIPNSHLISTKKKLVELLAKYKKIAIKPFTEGGIDLEHPRYYAREGTSLVESVGDYPDEFEITLVQKYIEKKYELRIFFLHGRFYASAIFSQQDEKTKVDFRNYNFENPNRVVPFSLPIDLKNKLLKLVNNLKLTCGSIDMIVSTDNNYVFLEINPVGQFHQVSYPCNYHLEYKIANYLANGEID